MSLTHTLRFMRTLLAKAYVVVVAVSMIVGPIAPVFVSKALAVPPVGISLPASGGSYNSSGYTTHEYWGPSAQSCGYSYDAPGLEDGTGWNAIPCMMNAAIPVPDTEGPHTLYISAWDGADYTSSQYVWNVAFTYDNTAPAVTINSPMDASEIADLDWGNPQVSWDDSTVCEYHFDGDDYSVLDSACNTNTTIPKPTSGEHTLYVRGTDAAGNQTEQSISFLLDAPLGGGGGGGGGGGATVGSVSTGSVTDVTDVSATASGSVTSDGGASIIQTGMVYDTVSHPGGIYDDYAMVGHSDTPSNGDYTTALVLTCGTTYYYRAFVLNDVGYSVGEENTFMSAPCATDDVTTGLVAHWTLDDGSGTTAADSTANHNDLTTVGMNWTTGYANGGLVTTDPDAEANIGTPTNIPLHNSAYTLSAWFKTSGGTGQGILGWGNYTNGNQVNALRTADAGDCSGGNGVYNYWWGNDIVGCAPEGDNIYDGTWHHVVAEYNGVTRSVYIDNTLVNSDTPTALDVPFATNLTLGTTWPGSGEHFDGSLDEVRVYNRALTVDQIGTLYAQQAGATPDGSAEAPYQIHTCADFENISSNLSAHYILESNLVCGSEGNAIEITGSFSGELNGNGHSIAVKIRHPETDTVGLFSTFQVGASVHDLWVKGIVEGASIVGAVVGNAQGATIARVISSASVVATGIESGGIAGQAELGSTIQDSYSTGKITAAGNIAGGIVGFLHGSDVTRSYFSGTILATSVAVGGIVGLSYGQEMDGLAASHINDSFSVGTIPQSGSDHAGILGEPSGGEDNIVLSNNFWDATSTGLSMCQGGGRSATETGKCEGVSSDLLKESSSTAPLNSWDFSSVWNTRTGGYPQLRSVAGDETPVGAGMATYRYVKWSVTGVEGDSYYCPDALCLQASEFRVMKNGSPVAWPDGTTATNPGGSNADNGEQGALRMIDGDFVTKWLDGNIYLGMQSDLVIDTGVGHTVQFNGYEYVTGDDTNERDPIDWQVYGSNDGTTWTLLDTRLGTTPPGARNTVSDLYTFAPAFESGAGTTEDPYLITSCEDLAAINSNLDKAYALTADLDCTTAGNAINIGISSPFTGIFDGQGHLITIATTDITGLFYHTVGATIKNLALAGTVNAGGVLGALVGYAVTSNISFVHSSVAVTSAGADQVGGLIGYMRGGTLQNSYATGAVVAENWNDGGLVGLMSDNAVIKRSYATGNVTGGAFVGGLVGSASNSTILYSFSTGHITAGGYPGGLIGTSYGVDVSTDYFDAERSGMGTTCSGDVYLACTGVNQGGTQPDYFKGTSDVPPLLYWDFVSGWATTSDEYPLFQGDPIDNSSEPILFHGGDGSVETPYEISTCTQLEEMGADAAHLAAHYRLVSDVQCVATSYEGNPLNHAGQGFDPVGDADHAFTGTFEGHGNNIFNLYINRPDQDYTGLFARLSGATVHDVYIHSGQVWGLNNVGLIAGYAATSTLDEIETGSLQIVSGELMVGGIVGHAVETTIVDSNYDGEVHSDGSGGGLAGEFDGNESDNSQFGILNSHSTANIMPNAGDDFGGLVGYLQDGFIRKSYVENMSPVQLYGLEAGASNIGGLVGLAQNASIQDTHAYIAINGVDALGGLVGSMISTTIADSVSLGTVVSGAEDVYINDSYGIGGLVGFGAAQSVIITSHSDVEVTAFAGDGNNNFFGGLAGTLCFMGSGCGVAGSYATGNVTMYGRTSNGTSSYIDEVGGLVGFIYAQDPAMNFSHNYATGNVQVQVTRNDLATNQGASDVGGLYGVVLGGVLEDSFASGSVIVTAPEGEDYGGFAAALVGSTVQNDFSSSPILVHANGGTMYDTGGFAGYTDSGTAISTSYAAGDLELGVTDAGAFSAVGGFVGESRGTIHRSYATGSQTELAGITNAGEFIGSYFGNDGFSDLTDNYYLHGASSGLGCVGSDDTHTVDLVDGEQARCVSVDHSEPGAAYFFSRVNEPYQSDWDFDTGFNWIEHASSSLPTLRGLYNPYEEYEFDTGDGSAEHPYQVNSCDALHAIDNNLGANYILMGNLTCHSFQPIGLFSEGGFHGTFDGNSREITTYIDEPSYYSYIGLFSGASDAYIHDLYIHGTVNGNEVVGGLVGWAGSGTRIEHIYSDTTVTGTTLVGGIAGQTNQARINDVTVSANVTGTGDEVGGIIGGSAVDWLFNLYTEATVAGHDYVGGLIGQMDTTRLMAGQTAGTVTGHDYVGGAVGYATLDDSTMSRVAASADVTGRNNVGGAVGSFEYGTLQDTLATGNVEGVYNVGGLVGGADNATIARTYSKGDVIGIGYLTDTNSAFVGGLVARGGGDLTVRDSFTRSPIKFITAVDGEGVPTYEYSPGNASFYGAFYGYTDSQTELNNINNSYDVGAIHHANCDSSHGIANCMAINTDDAPDGTYYFNSSTNAPFSVWDFEEVWQTGMVEPTLSLPIEANITAPTVDIISPESDQRLGTWSPSVDWGDAVRCFYSYGESDANTEVDCSQHGADIPAPNTDGPNGLNIRAENVSGISSEYVTHSFTYYAHPYTYEFGDGSVEDPFVITSCADFAGIVQYGSSHFILDDDLTCDNLAQVNVDGGFSGVFDGDGHTLTYTQTVSENGGLFEHLQGAEIEDLTIAGSLTSESDSNGAIAAYAYDPYVHDVHVAMNVTGTSYTGGLFGWVGGEFAAIRTYVSGTITGVDTTGGITGYTDGPTLIQNSYVSGAVSANSSIGGMIGYIGSGSVLIQNSYVSGAISGDENVGGLVGIAASGTLTTTNSFVDSQLIFGEGQFEGTIAGQVHPEAFENTNSWFNASKTGLSKCATYFSEGTSLPIDQEEGVCEGTSDAAHFTGDPSSAPLTEWDFEEIWDSHAGAHPTLKQFFTVPEDDTPPPHEDAPAPSGGHGRHPSGGGGSSSRSALSVSSGTTISSVPATPGTLLGGRDLQKGNLGDDVKRLQLLLIAQNTGIAAQALAKVTATGVFAQYTRAALIEYQKVHDISPATGYFGPRTRAQMKAAGLAGLWW